MPDKQIPEALTNFRVYLESEDLLGTADVELPKLEALTTDLVGAGVAGKIEAPIVGHYDSMTVGLTWRTISENVTKLAAPKAHQLDLRGSMQVFDPASGEHKSKSMKLVVKSQPKSVELGKMESGEQMETKTEFEITYLKLEVGGAEKMEIDKMNYICKIEGTDYLQQVRTDLGL
jgi:P2 family phage contractile tail tube protein